VTTSRDEHLGAAVVVNRTVTVNNRTYGSLGELPPDVRQKFEDALKGAQVRPRTSVHLSLNMKGPEVRSPGAADKARTPVPLPLESSSLESRIRELPPSLAIIVAVGLVLWVLLGR
jgi:hypothetical protein